MAKFPRHHATTPRPLPLRHISVTFKPDTAEALTAAAARMGVKRTALVRRIVEEWVREQRRVSAEGETTGSPPEPH
jgi:hypothetical protein